MKKKSQTALRKSPKRLANEDGFTMFELVVTLFLTSLLGMLVISAFIFVNRSSAKRLGDTRRESEIRILSDVLQRDIERAGQLPEFDSLTQLTDLTLIVSIKDTITYNLNKGRVSRNGLALHHRDYNIDSIGLSPLGKDSLMQKGISLAIYYTYGEKEYEQRAIAVLAP